MSPVPLIYVSSTWGVLAAEQGADLTGVITSAGTGAAALAVGWALLRRSDHREDRIATQLRADLATERAAHDQTMQALLACLTAKETST